MLIAIIIYYLHCDSIYEQSLWQSWKQNLALVSTSQVPKPQVLPSSHTACICKELRFFFNFVTATALLTPPPPNPYNILVCIWFRKLLFLRIFSLYAFFPLDQFNAFPLEKAMNEGKRITTSHLYILSNYSYALIHTFICT